MALKSGEWGPIWGSCAGLPIQWHATVAIIPIALFMAIMPRRELAFGLIAWPTVTALLIASIILHEAAHAFVARRFGIGSHALVIHGLGGFVLLSGAGGTRRERNLVSLAGPAANLAFASILFALLAGLKFLALILNPQTSIEVMGGLTINPMERFWQWRQPFAVRLAAFVLGYAAALNLVLGLLNLLPGYPLDGGAILHRQLSRRFKDPRRSRIIGLTGLVSGYAVVGFGLSEQGWGGLWMFGAGLMVVSLAVCWDGRSYSR
jgi:stage IV sporulation protein FB